MTRRELLIRSMILGTTSLIASPFGWAKERGRVIALVGLSSQTALMRALHEPLRAQGLDLNIWLQTEDRSLDVYGLAERLAGQGACCLCSLLTPGNHALLLEVVRYSSGRVLLEQRIDADSNDLGAETQLGLEFSHALMDQPMNNQRSISVRADNPLYALVAQL